MKRNTLLAFMVLTLFSLQGCGSQDGAATTAATTTTPTTTTPTTTTPTTTSTVVSAASLGILTDLGDYLNSPGEEWFFSSTKSVSSAGLIIGDSPANVLIFWNPISPDVLGQVPIPAGKFYDDYYDLKAAGGVNDLDTNKVLKINDNGLVIGNVFAGADESRGFVWDSVNDIFVDLAPPNYLNDAGDREFGLYSNVTDISTGGAVLLTADDDKGERRVFRWDGVSYTTISDLRDDGGALIPAFTVPTLTESWDVLGSTAAEAIACNDVGQCVFSSTTDTGVGGVYNDFTIGGWASLGTLATATTTTPIDINNNKHIVGMSGDEGFFWAGGVMYPISNPTGAAVEVVDINNNDIVIGNSGGQAFVWSIDANGGVFSSIGTLGGTSSTAVAINDRDEVVGYADTANSYTEGNLNVVVEHGFLWKNEVMYDLGAHSPPNYVYPFDPDFYFSEVAAISESGIVVGKSYSINGHSRGFTLTPVFP